jgi:hypothetical protein
LCSARQANCGKMLGKYPTSSTIPSSSPDMPCHNLSCT